MEEAIADLFGNNEKALLDTLQILDPRDYLSQFLQANTRPSSRPLHTPRPTTILSSTLTRNTSGSALVRIGETQVLAGTSLLIGTPTPSYPKSGDISIHLDMGPMCSPKYNSSGRIPMLEYQWNDALGQQSLDKQKMIESWIMRTLVSPSRHTSKTHSGGSSSSSTSNLNNAAILDLEELCIQPHKSAWKVIVSVMVLNHDGNVEDAAFLAALAALKDTVLPPTKVVKDDSGREVVALDAEYDGYMDSDRVGDGNGDGNATQQKRVGKRLTLSCIPISLTVGFFCMERDNGDGKDYKMLVDPTGQEENVMDGIMSIVVGVNGNEKGEFGLKGGEQMTILSVNKPGGKVIVEAEDIAACMQLCQGRAQELAPIIQDIGR